MFFQRFLFNTQMQSNKSKWFVNKLVYTNSMEYLVFSILYNSKMTNYIVIPYLISTLPRKKGIFEL